MQEEVTRGAVTLIVDGAKLYAVKSLIFHIMCYSNHHHRFRDKAIQQFDALFYEKGV